MKPHILFFLILLTLLTQHVVSQVTLYPPLNLHAGTVETAYYVTWNQPQLPGGGLPAGLLGYRVYMDGSLVYSFDSPDSLACYIQLADPCLGLGVEHMFWATSWYDLTSYGYPGTYGESPPSNTDSAMMMVDGGVLPFQENWDQGTFTYNGWTFTPDQSHWSISTSEGNPFPSAVFTGLPSLQNYEASIRKTLWGALYMKKCQDIWLDFDLKLENLNNTGSEHFLARCITCDSTYTLYETNNSQGLGWTHVRVGMNEGRGAPVQLEFQVTGENSANLQQWLLDNIEVSFVCHAPESPGLTLTENEVHLFWTMPSCADNLGLGSGLIGYNVYRTDTTGLPPFYKLNPAPVVAPYYIDVLPWGSLPANLSYCIKTVYNDSLTLSFLCESDCSDTLNTTVTASREHSMVPIRVFPNPSEGRFRVDLEQGAYSVTVTDLSGNPVWSGAAAGKTMELDLSFLTAGVYVLRVDGNNFVRRGKIVIY